jgi:hypothetical protein
MRSTDACHGACILPDALQRSVTNRPGREREIEGDMQNSLCIEELELNNHMVAIIGKMS